MKSVSSWVFASALSFGCGAEPSPEPTAAMPVAVEGPSAAGAPGTIGSAVPEALAPAEGEEADDVRTRFGVSIPRGARRVAESARTPRVDRWVFELEATRDAVRTFYADLAWGDGGCAQSGDEVAVCVIAPDAMRGAGTVRIRLERRRRVIREGPCDPSVMVPGCP